MFYLQAYDIARADQVAQEAQLKSRAVAGIAREQQPGVAMRAFTALRSVLTVRGDTQVRRGAQLVTSGASAK
jgi:hypothetical protein